MTSIPGTAATLDFLRRAVLGIAIFSVLWITPAAASGDTVRFGFTVAMLPDLNESDAKASIQALATAISRERGLEADPVPHLYDGTDAATAGLRAGTTNAMGLTTEEFWLLRRQIEFDGFLVGTVAGDPTESYLVLAPGESRVHSLADLRGRPLAMLRGPQMSLTRAWLDVELAKQGLPAMGEFFGPITESSKPSRVVLPLFFGQRGVCVINRHAYETMVELNPQISQQLRIVASSPGYVASFFALSRAMSPDLRGRTLREMNALDRSVAGQQVLTIFHTQHIAIMPEAALRSALDLLDEHAQRCPAANALRILALRRPRGNVVVR